MSLPSRLLGVPLNRFILGPRTRRGIFFFFVFGILGPSGVLGYLGFRSFQYETLLLRRQAEERYAAALRTLERGAEEIVQAPLNALRRVAAEDAFTRQDHPAMIRRLLALKRLDSCSVDECYLLGEQGELRFPYVPAAGGAFEEHETEWGPIADEVERLERMEFAEKKYAEALSGYQALLKKGLAPVLQGALLQNIVGVARRLGDVSAGEAAAQRMIQEFDDVPDASGVPFGVRGRQLLIKMYDASGRRPSAAALRKEVFEGLLYQRWPAVPHAAEFLEEASHGLNGGSAALSSLQRLHERGRPFAETEWPLLLGRLRGRGWLEYGGVLRSAEQPAQRWIVAVPLWARGRAATPAWLVAVIAPAPIWQELGQMLPKLAAAAGLQATLTQFDPASSSFWQHPFDHPLNAADPSIVLRLRAPANSAEDRVAQRRFRVYGGMIVLSFLVMLIGLVLMAQAMRREMEISGLKADFVASVSHDLRTPLMSINYISERLRLGRYRSQDDVHELYGILGQESGRLQEMIERVLEFSRLLSAKRNPAPEAVDLDNLIAEAVSRMRTRAEAEGFALEVARPPERLQIRAQPAAALQAITNLIDNAFKYSGAARSVRVEGARENGSGVVRVIDQGVGIPVEDQERIFEKFERAGKARDLQRGIGLGLAMVKHIMETHGGRVTVQSVVGQGSTFVLHFPLWNGEKATR